MIHKKSELRKSVVALVPAAGMGARVGQGPKAFLQIGGESILLKVVRILSTCVTRILVGVPDMCIERARHELGDLAEVFSGGASRQETVCILLNQSTEPIVLIHDVARAFASPSLIQKVVQAGRKYGAAVSCIPISTPVATCKDNFITASIPRSLIRMTQSPQAFHRNIMEQAYIKGRWK